MAMRRAAPRPWSVEPAAGARASQKEPLPALPVPLREAEPEAWTQKKDWQRAQMPDRKSPAEAWEPEHQPRCPQPPEGARFRACGEKLRRSGCPKLRQPAPH